MPQHGAEMPQWCAHQWTRSGGVSVGPLGGANTFSHRCSMFLSSVAEIPLNGFSLSVSWLS